MTAIKVCKYFIKSSPVGELQRSSWWHYKHYRLRFLVKPRDKRFTEGILWSTQTSPLASQWFNSARHKPRKTRTNCQRRRIIHTIIVTTRIEERWTLWWRRMKMTMVTKEANNSNNKNSNIKSNKQNPNPLQSLFTMIQQRRLSFHSIQLP